MLFQALEDYRLEVARQRWHDFARPLRELPDLLQGHRHGSIATKGWTAGYHFVEQQAHRVEVSAGIHGFELRLLGGHVRRRANDGAGQRPIALNQTSNTKIHDFHVAISVPHAVCALPVTGHDYLRTSFAN